MTFPNAGAHGVRRPRVDFAIIARALVDGWPFEEDPHVGVFTTRQVMEGLPILLVTHDPDHEWQFLCGTTNADADLAHAHLHHLYESDPTIGQLADLPIGWQAWRASLDTPWERSPLPAETLAEYE